MMSLLSIWEDYKLFSVFISGARGELGAFLKANINSSFAVLTKECEIRKANILYFKKKYIKKGLIYFIYKMFTKINLITFLKIKI